MSSTGLDSVRIIIFVRSFNLGGSERQAVVLARFLKDQGASVLVWSFTDGRQVKELLNTHGVKFHVRSPGIGGSFVSRIWKMLRFTFEIRRFQPDILMPFTDLPNKICGALWPLSGATACIWNQRDEGREVTGRPLEKIALRITPSFVANSEAGRIFLNQQFSVPRDNIHLVPNGVHLEPAKSSRDAWRARLGLDPDVFVATMIANLHHFKDHFTLLQAWNEVLTHHHNAVLLLAGHQGATTGDLDSLSRKLGIDNKVRFLGTVDDVPGLLSISDLAVFSSQLEGCPNGILEPMASGLPVVATDIIGSREALGQDYPFLIPEKNPHAFAEAILTLINDRETRIHLGNINQQRVIENFDPSVTMKQYLPIITQLLA